MDFFRSILADDPEPETPENYEESDTDPGQIQSPKHHETEEDDSTSNVNSSEDGSGGGDNGGLWSFGDLVKTLTTRSESVFETYRRDLKEFGTGLRKESDLFREVASRAVKELPTSIDAGASAIDGVLKSTADIIAQGKEALLAPSDVDDSDASEKHIYSDRSGSDSMRYSRFDAQLNAIRTDARAYCEDPVDLDDYSNWKLGFVIGDMKDEIEKLVGDNGALQEIYSKVVPIEVDDATFWFRYFYKVHKLKQQEEMRAKLVKRSLSVDDDEELLSWDVDEDDEEDKVQSNTSKDQDSNDGSKKESPDDEIKAQSSNNVGEDKLNQNNVEEQETKVSDEDVPAVEKAESVPKSEVDSGEIKADNVTVKSNEPSIHEEEDIEWDEIEDLGKTDDKKVLHGDMTNKGDVRKLLTTAAADEEDDLGWDIEDDDEPLKPGNK